MTDAEVLITYVGMTCLDNHEGAALNLLRSMKPSHAQRRCPTALTPGIRSAGSLSALVMRQPYGRSIARP